MDINSRLASCHYIKESNYSSLLIWGAGITGISLLKFFAQKGHKIALLDSKPPTKEVLQILHKYQIPYYPQEKFQTVLQEYDYFIPSPGIPLLLDFAISAKHIPEFDLFSVFWTKKILAITGSVGKTSITTLLHQILNNTLSSTLGGNIGNPLFNIVNDHADLAIIEASNLQLQHTKIFAPDYAIITNIYDNHLDAHANFKEYVQAKLKILSNNQNKTQVITSSQTKYILEKYAGSCNLSHIKTTSTREEDSQYFFDINKNIVTETKKILLKKENIPPLSYSENWILITALLDVMGYNSEDLINKKSNPYAIPDHRLEKCGQLKEKEIIFFNDSKSTILESTLQALKDLKERYPNHSITLLVGGTSKGVNRAEKLNKIPLQHEIIGFFGSEAEDLYEKCKFKNTFFANTLSDAFNKALEITPSPGIILFSPGGASFDQFKNYQERGNTFKELIKILLNKEKVD